MKRAMFSFTDLVYQITYIIYTCINNALCNSNSGQLYRLVFYRYRYLTLPCLMILNFVFLE